LQARQAIIGAKRLSKLFSFGKSGEEFVRNGNVKDVAFAKKLINNSGNSISGGDGYGFASPVGKLQVNGIGLFDMHSNVWEWCEDVYDSKINDSRGGVTSDPLVSSEGSSRVFRGGGWYGAPVLYRSANRFGDSPDDRFNFLGFRVSLSSVQ